MADPGSFYMRGMGNLLSQRDTVDISQLFLANLENSNNSIAS